MKLQEILSDFMEIQIFMEISIGEPKLTHTSCVTFHLKKDMLYTLYIPFIQDDILYLIPYLSQVFYVGKTFQNLAMFPWPKNHRLFTIAEVGILYKAGILQCFTENF